MDDPAVASPVGPPSGGPQPDLRSPPCGSPPRWRRQPHANRRERSTRHGCRHDATDARSRCALRAPDPPLEPEDEALHLRRAQRHLHHRSRADADPRREPPTTSSATCPPAAARSCSSAPRSRPRTGPQLRREVRHAVRQRALAGRDAHQLRDHRQARLARCRSTSGCATPASSRRCRRRKRCCSAASWRSCSGTSAACAGMSKRPTRSSCSTPRRSTSPSPRPTSWDPGGRGRRHERRPRRGAVPDPGQRRRHPRQLAVAA